MQGRDDDRYVDSNFPRRRVAAQVGLNFRMPRSKLKPVLMERPVHIDNLKYLIFEDRSLYTVFTERQWMCILEPKGEVLYPNIVREFYNNLRRCSRMGGDIMYVGVRGVRVNISPSTIASYLDLPQPNEYSKSSHDWTAHEIYCTLTNTKDVYDHHHINKVMSQKDLLPFFQMLHHIVATNLTPIENTSEVSIEQGKFLLEIARGVDIDLPNHIFQIIDDSSIDDSIEELPFGLLITGCLLEAGVKIQSDEQGQQPMEPICSTKPIKPISQTGSPAYPSTQQAITASSSEDHQTRPPWFDVMLSEIDERVAAQIAPIKSQLKDMEDLLQELHDRRDPYPV